MFLRPVDTDTLNKIERQKHTVNERKNHGGERQRDRTTKDERKNCTEKEA